MYSLLLALIYLAFVSLGLPDSILGSVWPVLHVSFDVPLSYAGIVTMSVSVFTILSSLLSNRVTHRFGTGPVTVASVLLTVVGLFGYSFSVSFPMMLVFTVPYGLGAGAIDAALNNYVALHYSSRHMSWLHCFWGVGTVISPYIISYAIGKAHSWAIGYRAVGFLQLGIAAVLFFSLPLWKRVERRRAGSGEEQLGEPPSMRQVLRIPGVWQTLVGFFGYCSLESVIMLWTSSFFSEVYALPSEKAAAFGSLVYIGITVGRFLCGFVADRLGDRRLIRFGLCTVGVGILLLAMPLADWHCAFVGFIVAGFGCAPVYPAIMHATPARFGKTNSQAIIGLQMAFAYTGNTLMPLLSGAVLGRIDLRVLPVFLLLFGGLCFGMTEAVNRIDRKKGVH